MSSQWLWTGGMDSRRSGLNYAALELPMQAAGVRKKEKTDVFQDLQVMERAALSEWDVMIKLARKA